jgi:hypothetical protein
MGWPQRSEGLATTGQASIALRRFFRFSAARPSGRAAEKRKKRRKAFEGWPVVVNPPLRWGKPYENEMPVNYRILGSCCIALVAGDCDDDFNGSFEAG